MTRIRREPRDVLEFSGSSRFLSNFHPSRMVVPLPVPVVSRGEVVYRLVAETVEHGFQSDKARDVHGQLAILRAPSPAAAKKLGRSCGLRRDWDSVKLDRMLFWLRLKFAIPELRLMLAATGHAQLVEGNWWGDRFWGVCDGVGENHLGRLLMAVRAECALSSR